MTPRITSFASILALALGFVGACGSSESDAPKGSAGSGGTAGAGGTGGTSDSGVVLGKVTVHRDQRGTVHVVADDLGSAMYGLGWATARDRLYQMDFSRRWMQGRLAEWFGAGDGDGILKKDREERVLGFHAFAKNVAEALPQDVKSLLQAYADGVNAYTSAPGFELSAAYASVGETKFEPWTIADSLLVWDRLTQLFNSNDMQNEIDQLAQCRTGNCDKFPGCKPTLDEDAAQVKNPALASYTPIEPLRGEAPRKASHTWVVGPSRSTTGKAILHSDPQTKVTAPSIWYEYHLVAGDVNVRGIGVPGAPGFLIFWSQYLAQGLSAAGGDVSDLFELELDADGSHYMVDGQAKEFTTRTETIAVKNGSPETLTVKESMYGPVVDPLLGKPPSAGTSYAQRHLDLWKTDDHTLVAVLRMLQAKNLDQYREALAHWYTPGANALYAGDDGHIAYHALLGVPDRSTDSEYPNLEGRVPYDGSDSSHDWKGPLSVAERPNSVDPPEGYLFSANHMVVGSWYPHYTGFAGSGDTDRSLRLRYLFAAKLNQANGSGPAKPWDPPSADAKLTPDEVLAIHQDAGSDVVRILRDAYVALDQAGLLAGSSKAQSLVTALVEWKDVLTLDDPVTPLASFLADNSASKFRNLNYPALACEWGGGQPGLNQFLKAIDKGELDVTTDTNAQAYLIDMAEGAWDKAGKPGAPDTWPLGSKKFDVIYQGNFFCKDDGSLSPCALDPQESLVAVLDVHHVGTILSQTGNSYSQFVDFSAIESSRAVLPPGESEDPSSQWFQNQIDTWQAKDLVSAPSSLDSVMTGSVESVTLEP